MGFLPVILMGAYRCTITRLRLRAGLGLGLGLGLRIGLGFWLEFGVRAPSVEVRSPW